VQIDWVLQTEYLIKEIEQLKEIEIAEVDKELV